MGRGICASAAKHSRCGKTWNVCQLENSSRQFCQLGIHGTVCVCVCSTRVAEWFPLTVQFQTITPWKSGCGFTHGVQTAWFQILVHRLFGTIISGGKGRGGTMWSLCGWSNYGEKPHTAQGMNEAQRNLGEEIHLNQFEKFIWANSRNLS